VADAPADFTTSLHLPISLLTKASSAAGALCRQRNNDFQKRRLKVRPFPAVSPV
jgi:hypothetical protein